ncbi:formylglycine-generating enzyme family protein [Polyangium aurulentum]|uniref:formylglycine-generating enzyme family protein n=1 Tax=Polyangium aurulentum TaxID=2567896 RepID=UPI00146F8ACF|nr:SUMF1/EgtB/PvdO family nonheme iron enzyme [Polyangium aurulentum]UQA62675.1 SUMF1/EgtB/PvdO family nonheme iron enzyme [Polyangium aurulentum]
MTAASPRRGRLACGLLFCAGLLASALAPACNGESTSTPAEAGTDAAADAQEAADALAELADAAADAEADAEADALEDAATDALPGTSEGCPDDMVLVAGNYCPSVDQKCLEHHREYEKAKEREKKSSDDDEGGSSTVSERCLRYEEPSVCLSKERQPMRFCMDRYEWPNQQGELPLFLVSWTDARKLCEGKGKRLCRETEFNFACEGEEMRPYTYGYVRDSEACNIDKPYRKRKKTLAKYANCMKRPACKAELARLDQRKPAGSMPRCVSPFGVYDLNGNINEWVERPKQKRPNRSGLKGGWWGPVRGRCRPTVGFHKEEDYGYEEGFRCCKDASPG